MTEIKRFLNVYAFEEPNDYVVGEELFESEEEALLNVNLPYEGQRHIGVVPITLPKETEP
jgi:hypothetical protein